jgi:hypothetical protein
MDDVIYEAESALCNINKHYLQLYTLESNSNRSLHAEKQSLRIFNTALKTLQKTKMVELYLEFN